MSDHTRVDGSGAARVPRRVATMVDLVARRRESDAGILTT